MYGRHNLDYAALWVMLDGLDTWVPSVRKAGAGLFKARLVDAFDALTSRDAPQCTPPLPNPIAPATHCEFADSEGPSTEGAAAILRWIRFNPDVLCATWLQFREGSLQDTTYTHQKHTEVPEDLHPM